MDIMVIVNVLVRVLVGAGLGMLIGAERQWHQRNAGLRTNALVAVGASLYVTLSMCTKTESSPTRVAAQVVSGIGFLGAGVIIRDGLHVRGLNTAATLWCSAAIGCLAGGGYLWVATVGALCVVGLNLLLRPLGRLLDRPGPGPTGGAIGYRLEVTCKDAQEAHVRALLLQALGEGVLLHSLHSHDVDDRGNVSVHADLTTPAGRDDARIEHAASRLSLEPAVTSVQWDALDTSHQTDTGLSEERCVGLV